MTLNDGEDPGFKICGVQSAPSLLLTPGLLYPGVEIPVRVPSMGQINLFKNCLYSICSISKIS